MSYQKRAATAALAAYVERVGGESAEPAETQVTDLIADLLIFLVEKEGQDAAENALAWAPFHYRYEAMELFPEPGEA